MAERILVVLPNWVGDVVMATPTLAAIRARYPQAEITFLLRSYVEEIVAGGGWHDATVAWPAEGWRGLPALGKRLRAERFGLAVLLPNSFRSAAAAWLSGAPRRVGYRRDGRGWLLTEKLEPIRLGGEFVPVPIVPYYAALGAAIDASVTDRRLRLGITAEQAAAGQELLEHYGLEAGRYCLVNPGAAFGAAKCWLPERFAAVCDGVADRFGWRPVLVGAPREFPLLRAIAGQCRLPVTVCERPGTTLGSLKLLTREAAALVCNDTGPRHYGLAFDVPTVTVFGPTFQEWTDTVHTREVQVQARVSCGPCQRKRCPLDHRCMREVGAETVLDAVAGLVAGRVASRALDGVATRQES